MSSLPKVVSIGAGNVASHLIPALHKAGNIITQVYSRDLDYAQKLALKVKANSINDLQQLDDTADIYIIMVHDDAISDIVDKLPTLSNKQIVCHTSGGTPTTILGRNAKSYGSFYPLETFKKNSTLEIEKVPFLIHGSNEYTVRTLRMIARQVSTKVSLANDVEREQYHMSAVFLNNFSNHLVCLAQDYLSESGLDPRMLDAILQTTFTRMLNGDVCTNQTGPAIRNDIKVEQRHLDLLKEKPALRALYKGLSNSIKAKYHQKTDDENIG